MYDVYEKSERKSARKEAKDAERMIEEKRASFTFESPRKKVDEL